MLLSKSNKDIIISGSPGLVSEFTKLGLIDEYYFLVQPMISGNGKRLFEAIKLDERRNLKLVDKQVFKSGIVSLCYQNTDKDA